MPMYFPDLKSVRKLAIDMSNQSKEEKKYKGIIPGNEEQLPEARKQLAKYLRDVWDDEVFALEVELAVDENNYDEIMEQHIKNIFG